jgi:transcriptional regulator with XRE-family HTH domain
MPGGDPITQRRKLKADLQHARSLSGMTQRDAAKRLAWSESKLIRIENGEVGLAVTDLQALLRLYEVTDEQTVADLSEAARGSRGSFWWSAYRDVVSAKFALYLGQEASATTIRVFHPFLIPGLLHTEDYAFELLRVHCSTAEARRIVEMRQRRQQDLLGHADSPQVTFIFGEEALRRGIGGPAVMQDQLRHLLRASDQDTISVEVIPFSAGAHPGLLGPFILLDFEDPAENLLFVEGLSGDLVSRGDKEKVSRFASYFDALRRQILPSDQTKALIEQQIEKFRQVGANTSGGATQPATGSLGIGDMEPQSADAREDRWRSLAGEGVKSLRSHPPRGRLQSLACSRGSSATGTEPFASSRFLSSLSSASL